MSEIPRVEDQGQQAENEVNVGSGPRPMSEAGKDKVIAEKTDAVLDNVNTEQAAVRRRMELEQCAKDIHALLEKCNARLIVGQVTVASKVEGK